MQACRRSWEDKLKCVKILSVKYHNSAKICQPWIISPHALLELSLFVVLYADRIGGLGGYWIPESLVCHGHPPTRCHAPPPLTPDLLTTVYRVSLELSLCVELSQNRYFPTTPDTWSRPFGTCICSTCWDQSWHNMTMDVTPPILTTGLTSIQRSWSYLSLFCCFQPKFDVSCYCIVLGQRVAVWRCWINVWHDVCTSYLPTCQPPPPPPFFAAAATDQNGVSKYFILYMKIHRAPG